MELARQIPLNPPLSKGEKGDLTDLGPEARFLENGVRPRSKALPIDK